MEIGIYNRKMIEKRIEVLPFNVKTVPSSASSKQNNVLIAPVTHLPKSPTRYIKAQSIHPPDHQYPTYPSHWASSTHPSTSRLGSPLANLSVFNGRRPEIIELGGSRQKRDSLHRDSLHRDSLHKENEQSRKIEISADGLIRKISMLEGRIRQLHMDKQMAVSELTAKVNKLQMENDRLTIQVHKYQTKVTETPHAQFSEGNLAEMLSTQISINLELREQNQKLIEDLKQQTDRTAEVQSKLSERQSQIDNLLSQKQQHTHHQQQLQLNIAGLQAKVAEMEECYQKREKAIEEMVQQKQKRILQLQEQIYSLTATTQQRQRQLNELQQELTSAKLQHAHATEQLQSLQIKSEEANRQECKKCKELLHTIFRLNCQLNKK